MNTQHFQQRIIQLKSIVCATLALAAGQSLDAQDTGPQLTDTNLHVRAVVTNLNQPTSMAFLKHNDLLVLEKATGKVQRFKLRQMTVSSPDVTDTVDDTSR